MPVDRTLLNTAIERAHEWLAMDPDPLTRREVQALLILHDRTPLVERFDGELAFGTAGLRGLIGGGPTRMNLVTVAQATAGLARQLLADVKDAAKRGVVVGRDGRRKSPEFARVAAEVLAGHGIRVYWFDDPVPTPVAAFAGRHLSAAASVVVTASHNPPAYNGYKVFSERGSQIVPPQDGRIRKERTGAFNVREVPRSGFHAGLASGAIVKLGPDLSTAFFGAIGSQCQGPQTPPAPVRAVITSLHGVGHTWLVEALKQRGFDDVHAVPEQAQPDGTFPTVKFPNPEEDGALDLALALGRKQKADVILANDPDADRLCVAEADTGSKTGFRVLSGNELGILLADWLLSARKANKSLPKSPLVVTSIVSTSMLAKVAAAYGARCEFTLTGFKWIWDRALALESKAEYVFGFEEALGYCVGTAIRDKDGIGAAQVLMELVSALKAKGSSLAGRLDELAVEHGLHATDQVSIVFPGTQGAQQREDIMAALRLNPPSEVAGIKVESQRDFMDPKQVKESGLVPANVLLFDLKGGARVIIRPSGTEPKLKCYLEVVASAKSVKAMDAARATASTQLEGLAAWARETMNQTTTRSETPARPMTAAKAPAVEAKAPANATTPKSKSKVVEPPAEKPAAKKTSAAEKKPAAKKKPAVKKKPVAKKKPAAKKKK